MPKLTLYDGHSVWVCNLVVSKRSVQKDMEKDFYVSLRKDRKKGGVLT